MRRCQRAPDIEEYSTKTAAREAQSRPAADACTEYAAKRDAAMRRYKEVLTFMAGEGCHGDKEEIRFQISRHF